MKEGAIIPVSLPAIAFKEYLFDNSRNRMLLLIAIAAIVIQFSVFKYFYPFASYIHGDSFSYLETAFYNLDINTYMVGYSRFLRFFSVFSRSDLALVGFQYLLIQGGALFFLFTLFYFYQPVKLVQMALLGLMVLNPLFLHLANLVSSDGFFLALSLIWITLLLWIIHLPGMRVLVCHALVLFVAFTVRYNALIYPAIAGVVVFLSSLLVRRKIMAIGVPLILCGLFILYTGNKYKALTGKWQYSPFNGWQMANNAMYAYRYVDSADRKPVPARFRVLDNMIRTYFDSTRDVKKYPVEAIMAGTFYMWSPGLPLFKYKDGLFQKDTTATELKKWASMAPFYEAYGLYIIKQYPLYYAQYFLWPNAKKYYAPPVEFLATYNSGNDHVTELTRAWFRYKSIKVNIRTRDPRVSILEFYPICSGAINVVMILCLLFFAMLNGFRRNCLFRKGVMLGGILWLLNAGFTIFASSAALRFQAFPILLTTTFTLLLIDYLWKIGLSEKREGESLVKENEQSDLTMEGIVTKKVVV